MATTLTTKLILKYQNTYTNVVDFGDTVSTFTEDWGDSTTNGTGLDQADLQWSDQRTATAAVDDIDLNGVLSDAFGSSLDFVKIKSINIKNNSVTVGDILTIGAAAANPLGGWVADAASDKVTIQPGGIMVFWAPSAAAYPCGAGASDTLRVDPGANTITYDIMVTGTTA